MLIIPLHPLRDVSLTGKERLVLWETKRRDRLGKRILGYAFWPNYRTPGPPLFYGEDFAGPHLAVTDETLRGLLTFLTLRPGDTDREYFDDYTEEQLAYADSEAEYHSLWSQEDGEPFIERRRTLSFVRRGGKR
jgi:hypothetical protein